MTLPSKLCPCCGNALDVIQCSNNATAVFCSIGHCRSYKANDGTEVYPDETPEQAADRLIAAIDSNTLR